MRINLYAEELCPADYSKYGLLRKTADTGEVFFGLRVFLNSAPELHFTADDDDRSAVTFWFKSVADAYSFVKCLRNAVDRPEREE